MRESRGGSLREVDLRLTTHQVGANTTGLFCFLKQMTKSIAAVSVALLIAADNCKGWYVINIFIYFGYLIIFIGLFIFRVMLLANLQQII